MQEVTIYEKPTCSKCRVAVSEVEESGLPLQRVRYYDDPLSTEKLTELVRKMGISPRELLRTNEPLYRELGLKDADLDDAELIGLLAEHPDLMQRPILEYGDMAVLGRPSERVAEFLERVRGSA
jgi:arsenate reductase